MIVIEPQYLPSLEYFCLIRNHDTILFEIHAHYLKQTNRNRTIINTASGPHVLTVPVLGRKNHTADFEVRIDYRSSWVRNHLRTITSAYRNSPFFEHYFTEFEQILSKRHEFLIELNLELLTLCLRWLGWQKEILKTKNYESKPSEIDFRDSLKSKVSFSGRNIYKPIPYRQVFGKAFAGNMSLFDLICCCGPKAPVIIQQSDCSVMGN
jgi:hypothetical protein